MRNWLPFSKRYARFYLLSLLFAVVGAAWIMVNHIFEGHALIVCPSKLLFHIPCPGCGMTRAFFSLMRGDLASTLHFNANAFVVMPIVTVFYSCLSIDLLTSKDLAFRFHQTVCLFVRRRLVSAVIIGVEVSVWLHNIFSGI